MLKYFLTLGGYMKVFIGGAVACTAHHEKTILQYIFNSSGNELVDNYQDADLIILTDLCISTCETLEYSSDFVDNVLQNVKPNIPIIISGCLANGFKKGYEHPIFSRDDVTIVKQNELLDYIYNNIIQNDDILQFKQIVPYQPIGLGFGIGLSIVDGCKNRCSFCKSNYYNFELKSYPLEMLEQTAEFITYQGKIAYLTIDSLNLSQYGIDLYGKQQAHKAISILTRPDNIKYVNIGSIINWYPELLDEIINNPKIKTIAVSLETGSPRLYGMMNRPISLERWVQYIETIRKYRPDIRIDTEIIAGLPTERKEDIEQTLNLIKHLGLHLRSINPYVDFATSKYLSHLETNIIPSSQYPQHSQTTKQMIANYYQRVVESYNIDEYYRSIAKGYIVDELDIEIDGDCKQTYYLVLDPYNYFYYIASDKLSITPQIGDFITELDIKKENLMRNKVRGI